MKSSKVKVMIVIFIVLAILFYLRLKQVEISVQTFNAKDQFIIEATTESILQTTETIVKEAPKDDLDQPALESRQVYSVGLDQTFTLDAFNQLDLETLMSFKGIGLVTAEAIIEDRKQNGLLRSFDDLKRIKGIGEKKLANILYELP